MTSNLIEKLFKVGAHYGLSSSRRHPTTARYIFGAKGGIELFDLEKTDALLGEALAFVASLAKERKVVLFVGGKAEARAALRRTAEELNQPFVAGRWIGGTLTNWGEIKKRLNRLAEITENDKSGALDKFTKLERLHLTRERDDLETMFGGLQGMSKLPDAMVVVDPRAEAGAVAEAKALNIPVVALLNSDCDARLIAHPIPGNDASRETIEYILAEIAKTYADNLGAAPAPAPAVAEVQ